MKVLQILTLLLFISFSLCQNTPLGTPVSASYFGGSGADSITGSVFDSTGNIIIAGTTTSTDGIFSRAKNLPGDNSRTGFIASLGTSGTSVSWIYFASAVHALAYDPIHDRLILSGPYSVVSLSTDATKVFWNSSAAGACSLCAISFFSNGDPLILADSQQSWNRFDWQTGNLTLHRHVGKSRMNAAVVDPSNDIVLTGGDDNTHTCCEPWRDPYIFFENTDTKYGNWYDWNPKEVHTGNLSLVSDSFFRFFTRDPQGGIWIVAASDGGNTVFTRTPKDLYTEETAAQGKCLSGPCFGWKGANKATWLGKMKPDYSDLETQSWLLAYSGETRVKPCACLGGADVHPNGVNINGLSFIGDKTSIQYVVAYGASTTRLPETENSWYYNVAFGEGGFVSIFDPELKSLQMSTYLLGTGSVNSGDYHPASRKLIVGGNAGAPKSTEISVACLPTGSCVQKSYGGGASDGFFYVVSF